VVTDPDSPQRGNTREAPPFSSFVYTGESPLVSVKPVDVRWALANVLHFFSMTSKAGILNKYNKHAPRFLRDDEFIGAYGVLAVPQLVVCVRKLREHCDTRRAVVTVTDPRWPELENVNIPQCICTLHFLRGTNLDMFAYSRSLNLWNVMPYDLTLLANVHNFVAQLSSLPRGSLTWTVGSLHMPDADHEVKESTPMPSGLFPVNVLRDHAWECLHYPSRLPSPFNKLMEVTC
jgi:thymidylate synthase